MSAARSRFAAVRIEAARGVVKAAELRAITPGEWDRVGAVYGMVEDSVREAGDVKDYAALAVLSLRLLAELPIPEHAWGIRSARSSDGKTTYELRRFGWRWVCSCDAGRRGKACRHAAAEERWDREHVLAERAAS